MEWVDDKVFTFFIWLVSTQLMRFSWWQGGNMAISQISESFFFFFESWNRKLKDIFLCCWAKISIFNQFYLVGLRELIPSTAPPNICILLVQYSCEFLFQVCRLQFILGEYIMLPILHQLWQCSVLSLLCLCVRIAWWPHGRNSCHYAWVYSCEIGCYWLFIYLFFARH